MTVTCTFQGQLVAGFPIDVDLDPGVAETVEAPVGSVCTVVESDDGGATTVTYEPPNGDGTAAVVTVDADATAQADITITNDFPVGSVSLLKTVTGGVDPVFTSGPYEATLDCTFLGGPLTGFPIEDIELAPGVPAGPYGAPVGSVCTVTETDDQGATTVTYDPPSGSVTVTEASATDPIAMTVTNDFPVGGLRVTKTIGRNDADLDLDDIPYGFHYECTFDPGTGDPITVEGDLVATVNDPAEVDGLPAGAECTVTETDTQGGIATGPDMPVTIVAGTILQPYTPAPFVNDYPTGRAELVKLVDGDARDEFTGGPYTISVDCVGPGQTESFPGFPVVVDVVPGVPVGTELPIGTTCVFEELDVPAGVTPTYDPANPTGPGGRVVVPPVEPPPDQEPIATVTVTNTYTTGSLVITKAVSGPGAPAFSQGPFVFQVSCAYQGVADVYSVTVTVPGSPGGTPVQSDPVTGLPIGASCTVTETDAGGADIVAPPQTVTIEENEQANVAFVGVNNPFSAGSVSVVKAVNGSAASSPYVAGLTYTVAVECAVDRGAGLVTVLDEDVTVRGDGVPVAVRDDAGNPMLVPLGARCWGSEPDAKGATAVTIDHDSYEHGVEIVADVSAGVQPLKITVTNTFDAAALAVRKVVVNPPSGNATYTFDVSCTIDDNGTRVTVPVLSGPSPVVLAGGQTATLSVLVGSQCRITERAVPGATATIAETGGVPGGPTTDGTITVRAAATVVITNTFPAVLPATGNTGLGSILFLAAALVGGGVALLVLRRRANALGIR